MREIEIRRWCEFCWMKGETKEAATHSWSLGVPVQPDVEITHPPVKMLDVCDVHHELILMVQEAHLLSSVTPKASAAAAKPPAAAAIQRDPYELPEQATCPVCRTVLGKSSLVGHVWSQHAHAPKPESPTVCPDCGAEYDYATSCGTHRKAKHGYDPLQDALEHVPNFKVARAITAKGA